MVWGIVRFLGGHFLDRKTEGQEFLDMQPFVRKALRGERSLQPTAIGVGPAPFFPRRAREGAMTRNGASGGLCWRSLRLDSQPYVSQSVNYDAVSWQRVQEPLL